MGAALEADSSYFAAGTCRGTVTIAMIKTDLSDIYRDYIACLNKRDWPKLKQFVHDEVCYNGQRIGQASLSGHTPFSNSESSWNVRLATAMAQLKRTVALSSCSRGDHIGRN